MLYNSIQLSPNFSLSELTHSQTAIENAIDNTPDEKSLENLKYLCKNLLQPLRDMLGKPIHVTSGYRCEELNRLVGGVPTSQHVKGEAAACYCTDGPEFLLQILLDSGLEFDQAIVYKEKRFLHLSLKRGGGNRKISTNSRNRNQMNI